MLQAMVPALVGQVRAAVHLPHSAPPDQEVQQLPNMDLDLVDSLCKCHLPEVKLTILIQTIDVANS